MDIRILRYFLIVAREENITRAAELLHITQPTLSRQLIQLEDELGVKLFRRGRHNITLTEEGLLLKQRAQEIVQLVDKAKQELTQEEGELTGEIAIGCGEVRNMQYLAQILTSFQKEHPLVKYEIYSAIADDVKDRIEKGILDIGLLIEPVDIAKYEHIRMPLKERWGIWVSKDSEFTARKFVYPEDLLGVPLIISKREAVLNELANWFGDYYTQLEIVATYNLINNAAVMAMNRIGVVLCVQLDNMSEKLRFVPLSPRLEAGTVLVWKKHQTFSPVTAQFLEHVKNASTPICVP